MAFWPAVVLASRRELPIAARAVLLGVAFVLVDLALLAQSRASLVALPLTAVAAFLLVPGRVRLLLTLVPVAAGVALTLGPMLDVFPALDDGAGRAAAEDAFRALGIGFVLVVLAAAALAWTDRRVTIAAGTARRAELVFAVGAAALVLAGSLGALLAVGHPVARASDAWDEFNSGYPEDFEGSHFTGGGLGDYRADYWRVALGQFREQPLVGAGADNFAAAYIKERRFDNEARFPHSIPVAILSSTGIIGSAIFLALIGCVLASVLRGRARDPLAVTVGAAAVLVFTHWLVHGSIDWFLEIPALGAPAFAFLGAAAVTSSPRESERTSSAARLHDRGCGRRRRGGGDAALARRPADRHRDGGLARAAGRVHPRARAGGAARPAVRAPVPFGRSDRQSDRAVRAGTFAPAARSRTQSPELVCGARARDRGSGAWQSGSSARRAGRGGGAESARAGDGPDPGVDRGWGSRRCRTHRRGVPRTARIPHPAAILSLSPCPSGGRGTGRMGGLETGRFWSSLLKGIAAEHCRKLSAPDVFRSDGRSDLQLGRTREREASMKRLIGLITIVLAVMLVPVALAADPTVKAYGGVAGEVQGTLDKPATSETATLGTLPFTGLDLAFAGGAGILLVGLGYGLRQAARKSK